MNIQELNFLAFGPFSDRKLDFSSGKVGFHIVYGPNEAGKSSALRGLKALLYGIPGNTNDNFLHANKDLRIAGRLCDDSGKILEIVRRKGNKNTLLTSAGEPLDDAVLSHMMQGINAEIFDTLFGIGHEALVLGGREILEQKGEVGQALFSASIGSASLHHVLESLEEEALTLFRPAGSRQEINAHIKEYSDIQKEIRAISLSSRDWIEKHEAMQTTSSELDTLQAELGTCKAKRNRLQRVKRALPKFAQRRELLEQIELLGAVVLLPEGFEERRKDVVSKLDKANTTAQTESTNIEGLSKSLRELSVNFPLLEAEERIEDMHSRLGGHIKAMRDRPGLDAKLNQQHEDASSLIIRVNSNLTLEQSETLRPVLKRRPRITELGNDRKSKIENLDRAKKSLRDTEKELKDTRASLAKQTDSKSADSLRKQVQLARKKGDMDAAIQTQQERLAGLEKRNTDNLITLAPLWNGGLDEVPGISLPRRESLDRFFKDYNDLDQAILQLNQRKRESEKGISDAQRQLDEIEHSGSVPTELDLADIRSGRDKAWSLLRRKWIDGENVDSEASTLDPGHELTNTFEMRIDSADEIADRLRREASRVQNQASQVATRIQLERELEQTSTELKRCAKEKERLDSEWQALWEVSGISPLTPAEMRPWLEDMRKLQERMIELNQERLQLDTQEKIRSALIKSLESEFTLLDVSSSQTDTLESILLEAEELATRLESVIQQRKKLVEDIEHLEGKIETVKEELQAAQDEFEQWSSLWQGVTSELGLGSDALPSEADQTIQDVVALLDKMQQRKDTGLRIEGIDRDAEAFEREAVELAGRVSSDIASLPVEELIPALKKSLSGSIEQDTRRRQFEAQIIESKQRRTEAEIAIADMEEKLKSLCEEAACDSADDLDAAEQNSRSLKRARDDIETLEADLIEIGEGLSLEELEVQVAEVDPDTLTGDIDRLTQTIEQDLEPQQTGLAEIKGEQQSMLRMMDGKDDAAVLAEKSQSVLESIRTKTEYYTRVKIAARILRDEIERYRQENQGPLLGRASEHFAALTHGSFCGLMADFDEKDSAILVGIRPNESHVRVEGMSSGTRDQLYLSLRLASVEKYIKDAESMPFIVDDILVHFDDDRSKSTLEVLGELAESTQVILFTHHRRLIDQAKDLDTTTPVSVHEL